MTEKDLKAKINEVLNDDLKTDEVFRVIRPYLKRLKIDFDKDIYPRYVSEILHNE